MQTPNLLICEPVNLGHALAVVATAMTDAEVTAFLAAQPGRALFVYQLAGGTLMATVGAPHEPLPEKAGVAAKKKRR